MNRTSAVSLLVAGLCLVACQRTRDEHTLVIAVGQGVGSVLPVLHTSSLDQEIGPLLFPGLNSSRWTGGRLEFLADDLALAEGWTFGSDSSSLLYRLRPDARWSDGEPVDAGDVVFTYELMRQPAIGSTYSSYWADLDSVVAVDDRRVRFHFARRHPRMLLHSGHSIMPEHIFAGATTAEALRAHAATANPRQLVVSGPFRVGEWRPGERLLLERNPEFGGPAAAMERVLLRVLPEETTRLIELANGDAHAAYPIPLQRAAELDGRPGIRIETTGPRYYDFIPWNGRAFGPFSDPAVRRALSLAIDRRGILRGLGIAAYAQPAAGPYPPIFSDLVPPDARPDPYLPDSARAMLAARGWEDRDGDGTLDRDGRPFRFTLTTESSRRRRTAAAELIQAQLGRIGVRADLEVLEYGTTIARVFQRHRFQAALVGWQVGLDPGYLADQFWPRDGTWNVTGYASAALDSLIPRARSATTRADAAAYWRAAARQVAVDRPYAFLWFFGEAVALNERVRGPRIDVRGVFQNLHRWSLEDR